MKEKGLISRSSSRSTFSALIKVKEKANCDVCGMRSISVAWKDSVDRSAMCSRPQVCRCMEIPEWTGMDRNGPEWIGTDRNGHRNGSERTGMD